MKTMKILVLVIMIALCGCQSKGDEEAVTEYTYQTEGQYSTVTLGDVILKIENGYLERDAMNRIAMQVEGAVKAADAFLGDTQEDRSAEDPVVCEIRSGSGTTCVTGRTIQVYYATNHTTSYTSLITQAKAGMAGIPDWLREGGGAYAADLNHESLRDTGAHMIEAFMQLPDTTEEGERLYYDLDTLAGILFVEHAYPEAQELGDLSEAVISIGYAQEAYNFRGAYCVYAGSFVRYLDQTYGREALLRLYAGESIEDVMQVNKQDAIAAWQSSLNI